MLLSDLGRRAGQPLVEGQEHCQRYTPLDQHGPDVERGKRCERGGQVRRVPQYEETLPNGRTYVIREGFGDRGPADNTREFVVPAGHYFAMGDNRDDSNDSRGWGFVPADNLIGRAEMLFFSTDGTAGWLEPWRWIQATRFGRIFDSVD